MMKLGIVLLLSVFLVGCNTTKQTVVKTEYLVVDVPPNLYAGCKPVNLPNPDKITNGQVAGLIKELRIMNKKCTLSINAINDYLNQAKVTLETQ